MPQHRILRCYEYVNRPFGAVHDLLHRNPLELLRDATASASERANDLAGSLKVELAGVQLAVKVNLSVHSVRDAEGPAGMSPVTRVSIGWEAAHGPSLFPMMSAQLSAWPLTATETQIELEGEYTPPLGSIGQAIDAAVGHRIAEASVRRFLENVVQQIRDDLGDKGTSRKSDKEKGVMAKKNKNKTEKESVPPPSHTHGAQVGAVAGEIAGGIMGSVAGPPGMVAGMVMGAAAGALAGKVLDEEAERAHVHDGELDDAIGVTSGDLGAPNLKHPPAKTGAYSVASSGGGGAPARTPSSGPISGDGED